MAAKSYWVSDPRQIEAAGHPARHDIVDRLVALGPLSVRDLATNLGRNVTSIYHHLKHLEKIGLVQSLTPESSKRGRPHLLYKSIAPRIRLVRAAADPSLRAPLAKWARVVGGQAAKEYIAGMSNPDAVFSGKERNLLLGRGVTTASPERLARINELMDALTELVLTPEPTPGPLVSVGWFLSPLPQPSAGKSREKKKEKKRS